MRRRDFITVVVGAMIGMRAVRAQEARRVIGFLSSAYKNAYPGGETAFLQGLKDGGFIEGGNIIIEWRWADSHYDRLPSLATELLRRDVILLACLDAPSAAAAKTATKSIPIVFATGADPVKTGLVDSFNRPGGNLTGVSFLVNLLGPKRLELLLELVPTAKIISLLVNLGNPNIRADVPETQ